MATHDDLVARDANKLLFALILIELFLVLVFGVDALLGSPSLTIKHLFNLDGEGNIPAWFSSVQICLIGLVFVLRSRLCDPDHSPSSLFFLMVGVGFIFLSADEMASIHEKTAGILGRLEWMPRFKGGHGIWISAYAVTGLVLVPASIRPLAALWSRHRRATCVMGIGMGIMVLGAVVMEVIGYQFLRDGSHPVLYTAEVVIEESMEMFGASVILYGAILLLRDDSRVT